MQEVEQCMELLPRNLYTLNRGKISPVGRNDTLLIKLSILSVISLVENTASHGPSIFLIKRTSVKQYFPQLMET